MNKTALSPLAREIDEVGFSIIPDVVEPDRVRALRSAVLESLDADWSRYRDLPGKQRFIALDLAHLDQRFIDLLGEASVDRIFSELLDPYWILYSYTSTVLPPGERPYTCEIHNESARSTGDFLPSALVTLALDDFTAENGATWYLPGSHHLPDRPTQDEFDRGAVRVERGPGDAVAFHPRVWHMGGENRTSTPRVGLTIYACRHWMKQRFDYPRLVDASSLVVDDDQIRRVLGFHARVPQSMEEFYRPPERRLYRSGQG